MIADDLYGDHMIRIHTSVTQEEYVAAKREADRLGISLADDEVVYGDKD